MIQRHPFSPMAALDAVTRWVVRGPACASLAAVVVVFASGCAVQRGQETMGAYIDDTGITTTVKSKFFDSRFVDGTAISVETLNGTVMLSGFAKSTTERSSAEQLAREVKGVKSVKNEIAVRP